ncbi:hypothetical protein Plhal304r1_c001g0002581 [Plasmopara halstedii]
MSRRCRRGDTYACKIRRDMCFIAKSFNKEGFFKISYRVINARGCTPTPSGFSPRLSL